MTRRTWPMIAMRLLTTGAAVAITLVLAELYLRREVTYVMKRELASSGGLIEANPEYLVVPTTRGRRLVPGADVVIKNHYLSHRDISLTVNSLGVRGPELASPKPDGERRVLFLGDSVTIADSVEYDETFVSRVEERLREEIPGVRTINGGVGNTGTEEQLNLLEDIAQGARPDVVVLVYYLNDTRPPWGFSGEIGDRGWLRRHSLLADQVYRAIALWWWTRREERPQFDWIPLQDKLPWRTDEAAFRQLVQAARYDWGAAWRQEELVTLARNLDRFRALANGWGFIPALAIAPVSFQVEREEVDDKPQRFVCQLGKEKAMTCLDLLPALREHRQEEILFDQCHLTPRGHEVVAHALAPFVRKITDQAPLSPPPITN